MAEMLMTWLEPIVLGRYRRQVLAAAFSLLAGGCGERHGSPTVTNAAASAPVPANLAVTELGTVPLPAGTPAGAVNYCWPRSINNGGVVVGYCDTSAVPNIGAGQVSPFRFKGGEGISALPLPSPAGTFFPMSVNAQGVVAGSAADDVANWNTTQTFEPASASGGAFHRLLGWNLGGAQGINGNGQVVGFGFIPGTPNGPGSHIFRLSSTGQVEVSGAVGGPGYAGWGFGFSIDDNGDLAGASMRDDGTFAATVYTGGAFRDLNTLIPADAGWNLMMATGIKGGNVVGYGLHDGRHHAFRYGSDGSITDLGFMSTAGYTDLNGWAIPAGVNARGHAVGAIYDSSKFWASQAFFYSDELGGMVALDRMVDPSLGWTMSAAFSINDNDEIVGLGNKNGVPRAFLMKIPDLRPCPASPDQCRVAGTRDPATGECIRPPAVDGTACDDGNSCTGNDQCHVGECVGMDTTLCGTPSQCPSIEACDPAAIVPRFEGTAELGPGDRVAVFSYGSALQQETHLGYGPNNHITADGTLLSRDAASIPEWFMAGDRPGALLVPWPEGASTIRWTVGAQTAASTDVVLEVASTTSGPAVFLPDGLKVLRPLESVSAPLDLKTFEVDLLFFKLTLPTAEQESLWQQLKETFGMASAFASKYGGYYTQAKSAVDFVKTLLQTLQIIDLKSETTIVLEALSKKMDNLEEDTIGAITFNEKRDKIEAITSNVQTARQIVEQSQSDPTAHFNTEDAAFNDSAVALAQLADLERFFSRVYRPFSPPSPGLTSHAAPGPHWPYYFTGPAPFTIPDIPNTQFVFDWRMGLPTFMMGISERIQILAAANPGFTLSTIREEMAGYRDGLIRIYETMRKAVKCTVVDQAATPNRPDQGPGTTPGRTEVICADTISGIESLYMFEHSDISADRAACVTGINPVTGKETVDAACLTAVDQKWGDFWNAIHKVQSRLEGVILNEMPFFEIINMINLLEHYALPAADLTETRGRISMLAPPHLCLDVQFSGKTAGTPVWMWPCSGPSNGAQRWTYDRQKQTIVNPPSGKCLDVSSTGGVIIADCAGTQSQRWSYDPMEGVIYGGSGASLTLAGERKQGGRAFVLGKPSAPPGKSYVNTIGNGLYGFFLEPYWVADAVDVCSTGPALNPGADECAGLVCDGKPQCCSTAWDASCIGDVSALCGQSCN
jgi:hypothetical protein